MYFSFIQALHSEPPTRRRMFQFAIEAVEAVRIEYIQLGEPGSEENYTSEDWRALLERLPNVHTLYMQCTYQLLFEALSPHLTPVPAASQMLFPRLKHIWIGEVDLRAASDFSEDSFLNFVIARSQAGAPLEVLTIDELISDDDAARETLLLRLQEAA
jgi:hypothetical protein